MKTVLITGLSGNLGKAVAKKFLLEGDKVCGTISKSDTKLPELKDTKLETFALDLLNEEDGNNFVKAIIEKHKVVDTAVLTVGGFAMGNIENTGRNDIEDQIMLNFNTAWNIARPVFLHMMQNGRGRIFLIGSRAGFDMKQSGSTIAYGLSKSLIFRLSELMNEEAKGTNVVTSVIVPSIIDTAQNRKSMPDADFGKWVEPETIAEVIYFYCSPQADGIREPVIKIYNKS